MSEPEDELTNAKQAVKKTMARIWGIWVGVSHKLVIFRKWHDQLFSWIWSLRRSQSTKSNIKTRRESSRWKGLVQEQVDSCF